MSQNNIPEPRRLPAPRRHDMHYGLPKWAMENTHTKQNMGSFHDHSEKTASEWLEEQCGKMTTNKCVVRLEVFEHQGMMFEVYAYSYDTYTYGEFIAKVE